MAGCRSRCCSASTTSSTRRTARSGALAAGLREPADRAHGDRPERGLRAAVGSSNLFRFRERIADGLRFGGPALFSVFSGAHGGAAGLPPYLMAAAAMESRAFPAFTYDPSGGPDWASRFCLDGNPQLDLDWPIQRFAYEDEHQQRVVEDLAFTFVDFVASDPRYARHLARLPARQWNDDDLVAVDALLLRDRNGLPEHVPSVLMVDDKDRLHTVIVDERLMREARRCREMWHSLQELGGVHNSHAERLLARERKAWETEQAAAAQAAGVGARRPRPPRPQRCRGVGARVGTRGRRGAGA